MKRAIRLVAAAALALAVASTATLAALRPPRLDVPDQGRWVVRDVTLVEAGRPPRTVAALHVEAGRIVAIDADAHGAARTGADERSVEDLSGLFVAPGLSDLHVHYPPRVAIGHAELWSLLLLSHGVTSIRETGSVDGRIFEVREAIRSGAFPGPRIFACGDMLDGSPPSFPTNRVVTTPAAADAIVAELAASGADCIKAYNMLAPDVLAAIREAAERAGLPLIGHVPHAVPFEEAGLVDLQHGTGVVLVDRARIGRTDFRSADWATVDAPRIEHAARVSLERDIAHTPTLHNGRRRLLLLDPDETARVMADDSGLRHLPSFWPRVWAAIWGPPHRPGDRRDADAYAHFLDRQRAMTARLHARGVRIHAGTDTLMPFVAPGSSLHGELRELEIAGIAAESVWEIATRTAGRSLGERGLGTIEVGSPADLLFLRRSPAEDLAALREIKAVAADGRLYRRAELDAMLARMDAHFRGGFYASVMDGLIALVWRAFAPDAGDESAPGVDGAEA